MRQLAEVQSFNCSSTHGFNLIHVCDGGDDTYINACGQPLLVNERDFFIKEDTIGDPREYTNLQYCYICPRCGAIVKVEERLISIYARRRILDNCRENLIHYYDKVEEAKQIQKEYKELKDKYHL